MRDDDRAPLSGKQSAAPCADRNSDLWRITGGRCAILIDVAMACADPTIMPPIGSLAKVVRFASVSGFPFVVIGVVVGEKPFVSLATDVDAALGAIPHTQECISKRGWNSVLWVLAADADVKRRAKDVLAEMEQSAGTA